MTDQFIAAVRRARPANALTAEQTREKPSAGEPLPAPATSERDSVPAWTELRSLDVAAEEFVRVYRGGWLDLGGSIIRAALVRMKGLAR